MSDWSADFWVAATTIAPVVALAHGVNVTRYDRWTKSVMDVLSPRRAELEGAWKDFQAALIADRDRLLSYFATTPLAHLLSDEARAAEDPDASEPRSSDWKATGYVRERANKALGEMIEVAGGDTIMRASIGMSLTAGIAVVLNAIVLTVGLFSLAVGVDEIDRQVAAGMLAAAAWALLVEVTFEVFARRSIARALPSVQLAE